MMTKYQLVYIKIDSSLSKIGTIINIKKDLNLIKGFKAIQNYSVTRAGHKQLQKKLLYLMLDKKMGQMFSLLDMKMRQKMRSAFKQVVFQSKLSSYNTKILQE